MLFLIIIYLIHNIIHNPIKFNTIFKTYKNMETITKAINYILSNMYAKNILNDNILNIQTIICNEYTEYLFRCTEEAIYTSNILNIYFGHELYKVNVETLTCEDIESQISKCNKYLTYNTINTTNCKICVIQNNNKVIIILHKI